MLINKNFYKTILIIALVILFIVLMKWFHVRDYLSIEGFNRYRNSILFYENMHPDVFIIGYVFLYILVIACCIPGTIILDLLAGYIFGIFGGTLLVLFSYSVGSCINFLIIRSFCKKTLEHKFSKFRHFINGHGRYGLLLNLISLRLIAVIPFWVTNIVAALLGIRMSIFILSTFIGIIPSSVIYVIIGDGVCDSITGGQALNAKIMLNPKIWIPLIIMGILLMMPNIIKSIRHRRSKSEL